jgi:hypothetical protein
MKHKFITGKIIVLGSLCYYKKAKVELYSLCLGYCCFPVNITACSRENFKEAITLKLRN